MSSGWRSYGVQCSVVIALVALFAAGCGKSSGDRLGPATAGSNVGAAPAAGAFGNEGGTSAGGTSAGGSEPGTAGADSGTAGGTGGNESGGNAGHDGGSGNENGGNAGRGGGASGEAGSPLGGAAGSAGNASSVGGQGPAPGFQCFTADTCESGERCVSCRSGVAYSGRCVPDPDRDPAGYDAGIGGCDSVASYTDCDGPEDCGASEYCAYTFAGPVGAHCVTSAQLPAATPSPCCFTCDALPVCTLCWTDADCPTPQHCAPQGGAPRGVGGCQL